MAKRNVYREKSKPVLTFLYIVVVLALVAALAMMYMKDRDRRRQFSELVREAASNEVSLDIASVKERQTADDDPAEQMPEATAEPDLTPEPDADPSAALPEIYLPEPEQVEEALSEE